MEWKQVDGATTLRPAESIDNWFIIERADHEHKGHFETLSAGSSAYRWSGRISDADIEGSRGEMQALAAAIRASAAFRAKRCAVDAITERVLLWSPRNSQWAGAISKEAALNLADQIDALG